MLRWAESRTFRALRLCPHWGGQTGPGSLSCDHSNLLTLVLGPGSAELLLAFRVIKWPLYLSTWGELILSVCGDNVLWVTTENFLSLLFRRPLAPVPCPPLPARQWGLCTCCPPPPPQRLLWLTWPKAGTLMEEILGCQGMEVWALLNP